MKTGTGYRKTYAIRRAVTNKKSLEVTFPYEVVEKQARLIGITIEEFMSQFVVEAEYNSFNGVLYTFKRIDQEEAAVSG